jgi:uncharacterized protein YcbK (DUF882 family)
VSSKYAEMVRQWHTPPLAKPTVTPDGHASLVLDVINTRERIELAPLGDDAEWSRNDLRRATHALRDHNTNDESPIDPRLLQLVYRLQIHFDARAIRVVSGYRAEQKRASNHSRGRAMDLVVPGQTDADVAAYARTLGFAGVGLYAGSGFVHIDSRHTSYFWIDTSQPGRPTRTQQVQAQLAGESDEKAIARGEPRPDEETPTHAPAETNADRNTLTNVAPAR